MNALINNSGNPFVKLSYAEADDFFNDDNSPHLSRAEQKVLNKRMITLCIDEQIDWRDALDVIAKEKF